jgi:hypothetical protein
MLYVYGVTRAGRGQPSVDGLGAPAARVELIESGPIAAAVSELPDGYELHDEDAHAHLHVLTELLDEGPVLPVRMGTVAPNPDVVRSEVLDISQAELVAKLDSVDGFVELHVDADDDEAESIAALVRGGGLEVPRPADLSGRIELGEQIAGMLIEHRRQVADEILAELRPLGIRDAPRSAINTGEDPVLRWAFLVAQEDVPQFDQAVADVRTKHPELEIRYAGPLPAAHFADAQPASRPTTPEQTDAFQSQGSWGWNA